MKRKYKFAFLVAKISEIVSWLVVLAGILLLVLVSNAEEFSGVMLAISIGCLVLGLMLVFNTQMTLISIDTENNTRMANKLLEKRLEEISGYMETLVRTNIPENPNI